MSNTTHNETGETNDQPQNMWNTIAWLRTEIASLRYQNTEMKKEITNLKDEITEMKDEKKAEEEGKEHHRFLLEQVEQGNYSLLD